VVGLASGFVIAILATACVNRDFERTSKPRAINIRTQAGISRVYMAYDEAAPQRLTWYLCADENASVDLPIKTVERSSDTAVLTVSRFARGRPPLAATTPADEPKDASPSEVVGDGGPPVVRYLDERMTVSEFEDPVIGKGCREFLSTDSVNDAKTIIRTRLARAREIDELGPQVFATVTGCAGIVKEWPAEIGRPTRSWPVQDLVRSFAPCFQESFV
jgi:hypothetical protein